MTDKQQEKAFELFERLTVAFERIALALDRAYPFAWSGTTIVPTSTPYPLNPPEPNPYVVPFIPPYQTPAPWNPNSTGPSIICGQTDHTPLSSWNRTATTTAMPQADGMGDDSGRRGD